MGKHTDYPKIETRITPAEVDQISHERLEGCGCVVFDILRATSTMTVALNSGVNGIYPVKSVEEAVALHQANPDWLLAGEREGLKIQYQDPQHDGELCLFDFGNSPREFTDPSQIADRRLVMTTTNGTRALEACRRAEFGWIGSLLNRNALVKSIRNQSGLDRIIFLAAGTGELVALEDLIGIGATLEGWLGQLGTDEEREVFLQNWDDASIIAWRTFQQSMLNPPGKALEWSKNGRRLLANPDLAEDVPFCSGLDQLETVGIFNLETSGWIVAESKH